MPIAEIITIGTELLLGEIADTNTQFLAKSLKTAGIDLYRTMTVGDNIKRISQVLVESMSRAEIIITTGGLGPTVDDPTRQAVAMATSSELEFHSELWEQIQARFQRYGRQATDNNKRQAYIPQGATVIENPVGTAPAFFVDNGKSVIISLPGVPREMEYLIQNVVLPFLHNRFNIQETIKARVLHAAGIGESQVDELIGDLELLENPTVGLLAHAGQIDIRVTAKAETTVAADQLIDGVVTIIHERLGQWIYGEDDQTLGSVTIKALTDQKLTLVVVEGGLNGALVQQFSAIPDLFLGGKVLNEETDPDLVFHQALDFQKSQQANLLVSIILIPQKENFDLWLNLHHYQDCGVGQVIKRSYGGPPQMAPLWAINTTLDLLRSYCLAMK